MSIIFEQLIVMMYEFEISGNKLFYFFLARHMLNISDVKVLVGCFCMKESSQQLRKKKCPDTICCNKQEISTFTQCHCHEIALLASSYRVEVVIHIYFCHNKLQNAL